MMASIPTLAQVSQTKKRNRTFLGKPRPIKSGISLVKVPPVAHRSDVLLDDQIELVKSTQDELQHAMESLAASKTQSEMVYWKDQVDDLRAKSEEMVLILKVVSKLSKELVHTKMELDHVTENGGDTMAIRKRVVWLEDRMEALLSRYRPDEDESSVDTFDPSNVTTPAPTSASDQRQSTSTPKPSQESHHQGGGDAEVKGQMMQIEHFPPPPQGKYLTNDNHQGGGDAEVKGQMMQIEHFPPPPQGPYISYGYNFSDDEGTEERSESSSEADDDENEEGDEYEEEEDDSDDDEEEEEERSGVFLTEGTNSDGGSLHARNITFSPASERHGAEDNEEEYSDDGEADAVTKYWENPHHKFEWSEQRQVITRENPFSYHSLGLAVQSSFIERAPTTASELPWRPLRKASDMGDAQKLALDKLSERIHDIWGKMEDAAMMSIEINTAPNQTLIKRPESRLSATSPAFQQMQLEARKSATRPRTVKMSAGSRSPDKSVSLPPAPGEMLPPVEAPRHVSAIPSMVYHPPVIPKPEMLPIPRTTHEKRYPRISHEWNDTPQEQMPSTKRLVNQMNIANETKITLYKKKDKTKKPVTKQKTSGRRWKIARNPIQTAAQVAAIVSDRGKIATTQLDKASIQWMRVQALLQKLQSKRVEERRDAAMHLGVLDCSDEDILTALTNAIQHDRDDKVKYNATKALVSLGQWSEYAMTIIVKCMKDGSYDMQSDLVRTLINARNVHLVNKANVLGKQLIDKLKKLSASSRDKGDLGFESAICLGCMGVRAPVAKVKLMQCIESMDSGLVMKSLEVLVRQMRATEPKVINMVLHQFKNSKAWKHRAAAAKLLVLIGAHHLLLLEEPDAVFKILEQRLFDDPSREVRQEVAITLNSLGMRDKVLALVEKRLEDDDDDTRAHAVTAAGVLGMKADRIIRNLLEMLELDSCEYVRLQVIRTFATLGLTHVRIMRALREHERKEGPLAREATKALRILNGRKTALGNRSPVQMN